MAINVLHQCVVWMKYSRQTANPTTSDYVDWVVLWVPILLCLRQGTFWFGKGRTQAKARFCSLCHKGVKVVMNALGEFLEAQRDGGVKFSGI